jgi:Bacterial pre-peptidase C-terminal domain
MLHSSCLLLVVAAVAALGGRAFAQNDDCAGAIPIGVGATAGSTVGATTSTPAFPCGAGQNDVWYRFVAPSAGQLVVDTCVSGSFFDSVLEVLDGSGGCGALVSLGCNDDFCGLQSQVTTTLPAAGTYYLRVGGWNGATGAFTLNVTFGALASVVPQGPGCFGRYTSFHELLAAAAFDLSGRRLTLTGAGGGTYVATIAPGAVAPVGSLGTATVLTLTDDSQTVAGTLGLSVGSNCWVALGTGNANIAAPSVTTMLANPATAFYSWRDLNPAAAGSGQVRYEEAGTVAQITYDGVHAFNSTAPNTIQFRIDTATGNASITWGSTSAIGTEWLVGYSPGGPSLANPVDISAITSLTTSPTDQRPLSLTAIGRPVQGATAVNFDVTTGDIPAGALIHVGVVGLGSPGLPLGPALGATQCFLNASLDTTVGPSFFPTSSVTWTTLSLPALPPDFTGLEFYVQGAILGTTANPALGLGLLTSNGLKCTVGTL